MFVTSIVTKIVGSSNQRTVRKLSKIVKSINALEEKFKSLKDDDFKDLTAKFKERISNGETLEALLPEVFAVAREAAIRSLGLRPFDVQLMGGMVLNANRIAEMKTGEGKTLTALLPCYLNALSGHGVHVVTVNDYLARRDSDWSRPFYTLLGMTVGVNVPGLTPEEKREAYACDVTYGTNNEFGFDYLRDNMAYSKEQKVQRELNYALVDEVDSVLIDEARTPLIISGAAENSAKTYNAVNKLIPSLIFQEKEDTETYTGEGDSLPFAATSALRRNINATYLSFELASGSERILATCSLWAGRRRKFTSLKAALAIIVSPSASTFSIGLPSKDPTLT